MKKENKNLKIQIKKRRADKYKQIVQTNKSQNSFNIKKKPDRLNQINKKS